MGEGTRRRDQDLRDKPGGEPHPITASVERLTEGFEAQRKFVEAFRCPWREGIQPCAVRGESKLPMLLGPMNRVGCPLVETEPCPPAERYRLWLAEWDEQQWKDGAAGFGVRRRYVTASLSTGEPTEALIACRQWIARDAIKGRCLVLMGETGIGKTFASVAALRAFPGPSKMFWFLGDLASEMLHGVDKRQTLKQVREVQLLLLDDVGAEYLKPGGLLQAEMDGLIVHREAEMLPTIITTRLTPEEMKHRFTDSIRDRLNGSWAILKHVKGRSLRR